jgi:hypothetical protein
LQPGETKVVRQVIRRADLRYRDPATHAWVEEAGEYGILVGTGSATPPVSTTATL